METLEIFLLLSIFISISFLMLLDNRRNAIYFLLGIDKNEYDYIDLLAIYKYKSGKTQEAITLFEKLYSINPKNRGNITNLILSYNEIGNVLKSQEYQRRLDALEIN